MRSTASIIALCAPLLASAHPLFRRAGPTDTDKLVFKFAHVLEQLETKFYTAAIAKFKEEDFLAAGYSSAAVAVEQLQQIVADECAHTWALETAIKSFGDQPITNCQFNFDSALTDVATTMTVARVVENVGVGAYLGAAGLLSDPRFLTSAASILTIEARHQTVLNSLNGGATIPQAFDIPLGPDQVVSIASGFISGCDLGIKGTQPLAVTNTGPVSAGTLLTFKSDAVSAAQSQGQKLFCNMIVGGATTAISLPIERCIVPPKILGPVALVISNDEQPLLASDLVDQAKDNQVAGPALAFIDFGAPEQTIAQLILTPNSKLTKDLNGVSVVAANCPSGQACPPVGSETTNTISPEQASSSVTAAENAATAPADTATQTFMGDVIPMMPTATAGGAPAENTLAPVGSDGLPQPSANTVVGSDGLPLPTAAPSDSGSVYGSSDGSVYGSSDGSVYGSAGIPLPSDGSVYGSVGSDGLPIPTGTVAVGSDGLPQPTANTEPPVAGAGSTGGDIVPLTPAGAGGQGQTSTGGDIIPTVPSAPSTPGASTSGGDIVPITPSTGTSSGPEITDAGAVAVADTPEAGTVTIS